MRDAMSEFLPYTKKDKEIIWEDGTFVFDTNVLLNLYRYSRNTRDDLLGAFAKLGHRIWMPYHVAFEFMKNRRKVILDTIAIFDKAKDALLEDTQKHLSSLRIDKSYVNQIRNYQKRKLNDYKAKNFDITDPNEDEILIKLLDLFEGKVGAKYTPDEISKIKKTGAERYEKCIPPGYKDAQKAKDIKNNDNNAYGDYIIWFQMMSFAKDNKTDLVFVVDDRKEDWWEAYNGKYYGARQELLAEFYNSTGKRFLIYTMHTFLERLNDMKGFEIEPQTIEEAGSISLSKQMADEMKERIIMSPTNLRDSLILLTSYLRSTIESYDKSSFNSSLYRAIGALVTNNILNQPSKDLFSSLDDNNTSIDNNESDGNLEDT